MNYSKKHIKQITHKTYMLTTDRKYYFKDFKKWYRHTVFEITETSRADVCFRNQKKDRR